MKRNIGMWLVLSLLMISAATVFAQDYSMAPPKVLVVQREYIKPGMAGNAHMKTESAFVQAMSAAKWPTRYLGMDSMSGPSVPGRLRLIRGLGEGQPGDAEERHAVGRLGPRISGGRATAHQL
jgi:hypothetical protein